jgi:hypothetical protein
MILEYEIYTANRNKPHINRNLTKILAKISKIIIIFLCFRQQPVQNSLPRIPASAV